VLNEFGVDIWLFTSELWLTRHGDGEYVPHENTRHRADPTIVSDSHLICQACKIVARAPMRHCCLARRHARGHSEPDSQRGPIANYYLYITPPGCDKGSFVQTIAKRHGISTDAVATIGDMQNDSGDVQEQRRLDRDVQRTDDVKTGDTCDDVERKRGLRGAVILF